MVIRRTAIALLGSDSTRNYQAGFFHYYLIHTISSFHWFIGAPHSLWWVAAHTPKLMLVFPHAIYMLRFLTLYTTSAQCTGYLIAGGASDYGAWAGIFRCHLADMISLSHWVIGAILCTAVAMVGGHSYGSAPNGFFRWDLDGNISLSGSYVGAYIYNK